MYNVSILATAATEVDMPRSSILWDSNPGPYSGLSLGVSATISNDNVGDESSYSWALVNKPARSTAALAAGASPDQKLLTPDEYGTYVVRLIVDGGLIDVSAAAVLYPPGLREPAVGERREWDSLEGWADSLKDLFTAVGLGTPIGGFTDFATTGTIAASSLIGKLVVVDTSSGAVDMTFPSFTASHDMASGQIIRSGANLAQLLLPGGYNFLYPGGTASPFQLTTSGDSVRFIYRHSNTTIYLF